MPKVVTSFVSDSKMGAITTSLLPAVLSLRRIKAPADRVVTKLMRGRN